MQTAQHPSARSGRIWRLFTGEPAEPGGAGGADVETFGPQASDTLDLVDEALAPREDRLERLEAGIRLLAGALKRVHHDLSSAVAELRQDLARAATASDVEATVSEAVQPLQEAMGRLTESTQSLPLILGAATERLASRIETTRIELEETLIALMADAGPGGAPLGGTRGAREQEVWGR